MMAVLNNIKKSIHLTCLNKCSLNPLLFHLTVIQLLNSLTRERFSNG